MPTTVQTTTTTPHNPQKESPTQPTTTCFFIENIQTNGSRYQSEKENTSRRNFGSNPRSYLQLSQRENFKMIHHYSFENMLIPMTPNLTNKRNPNISKS